MAKEKNIKLDIDGFNERLAEQKERSRAAGEIDTEDWIPVSDKPADFFLGGSHFVGYDMLECDCEILRYRRVKIKGKEQFQLVLDPTPFYAESGGAVVATRDNLIGGRKKFIKDT